MNSNFEKTERGSVLNNGKEYFSASAIAQLLHVTRAAVYKKAAKQKWPEIRVPGKGGRNGVIYFLVPKRLMDQEDRNQNVIYSNNYQSNTAKPLTTGSMEHGGLTLHSHSGNGIRVNNFVSTPKYVLETRTTEGHTHMIHSEQIVDYLAFNKEWLDMSLDVRNNCLALITVKDDSMEPTLRSNDLILTDVRRGDLENNSIYVLQIKNELIVKRIQCKINGKVIVKSDNPNYESEELDELAAQSLHIIGKVIWYGRRI
ncbi:MAG: S24 family peptidase [Nitrosomonas sp. PRO4]|nr:S24 family peptidase [Nitrosomonas sp. PRO4]